MKIDLKKIWSRLPYIIIGLVVLLGVWGLWLKPLMDSRNDMYNAMQRSMDGERAAIQRERDSYKVSLVKTDTLISLIQQQQVLMQIQINQSQQTYKRLDAKLSDIPIRIAALAANDDSLIAAFAKFTDQ